MTSPEIHPAVDANNVQAKRNAEAFSEATKRAVQEAALFAKYSKRRHCKKATISLILRVVVAVALFITIAVLRQNDQLTPEVTVFAIGVLISWLSIWIGAWCQYMWGKWGLLK